MKRQITMSHIWILFVIGMLVTACGFRKNKEVDQSATALVPVTQVSFPIGFHQSVVWFSDGKIFVATEYEENVFRYFIWQNEIWREIFFPPDERCGTLLDYGAFTALPDGRLGMVKRCTLTQMVQSLQPVSETYLVALNWSTDTLDQIVAGQLPPIGASSFSWSPDMTRGVQEAGSIFRTIYWLTPENAEPMTVSVGQAPKVWTLDTNYWIMLDQQQPYSNVGIARAPAWSPDGSWIAFFASPDSIGLSGQSRLKKAYQIYLMSPSLLKPEPVLDGIYYPYLLSWSPDGRWLAFTGDMGLPPTQALWLYSQENHKVVAVDYGNILDFSWSPDTRRIISIHDCGAQCDRTNNILTLDDGTDVVFPPVCQSYGCNREIVIYEIDELIN